MRLMIERGELLRVLTHVSSVVERRTTIPILSNILLRADQGQLLIKGTDLEREVVEAASCEVLEAGTTTVSAHMLPDIVRKLADGVQVELHTDGEAERMNVISGQSRFQLPVLAGDEFPDIAAGEMSHSFELEGKELKELIEKTRFAISTEETRYYLNGIFVHTLESDEGPVLRGVATDGHRLARIDLPMPEGAGDMPGIIVPRKTVHEIFRLIEDTQSKIQISLSASKIQVTVGSVTMTSRLIDGAFPEYSRVIPQANDRRMYVGTSELATAVDRVATVSSDRGRAVKLGIEGERLVLTVVNPDGGSATEQLTVEYESEPLEIGFNARYLLDIFSQIEGERVSFKLADPGSPTIVLDESADNVLYVLMPMRV